MSKILIVDDSISMRQMINFTLSEEDHQIFEAENGKEAMKKLEEIKPEIIITDINMPEMNGIELIKAVRGSSSCKFVPIIVLTTESEKAMQDKGKQAGATAWLVKPFTPEKLIETVAKVG